MRLELRADGRICQVSDEFRATRAAGKAPSIELRNAGAPFREQSHELSSLRRYHQA